MVRRGRDGRTVQGVTLTAAGEWMDVLLAPDALRGCLTLTWPRASLRTRISPIWQLDSAQLHSAATSAHFLDPRTQHINKARGDISR